MDLETKKENKGNLSNLLNICTKEMGKLNKKAMYFLG